RLNWFLERRLPGLNAADKTLAEHADRAEFHRSREFIATAWAGALGLFAHGSNHPSVATSARSNTTLAPTGAKLASTAPGKLLSRSTAIACYVTVPRQITFRNQIPAARVLRLAR